MMEAERTSETSVDIDLTKHQCIPEDSELLRHKCLRTRFIKIVEMRLGPR
jgi:hypothetical protein